MQMQTTLNTLRDMNFASSYLVVMNKCDQTHDSSLFPKDCVCISAKENLGIDDLKRAILQKFKDEFLFCQLFVPYTQLSKYASIKANVIERNVSYTDAGQTISAVIPVRYAQQFQPFIQSVNR